VENGCGISVPPENPSDFADALEDAEKNRDGLRLMGQRGRVVAEEQFNRSKLANHWVDWVTGVMR
jgi:glycosyltransferase involved in cell wall biosynthesis